MKFCLHEWYIVTKDKKLKVCLKCHCKKIKGKITEEYQKNWIKK